ncbi:MAG: hypothetical protein GEU97_06065 [Actinophytocola sp.]|nr:hypothetical protein [Actinophytocola sp.]
MAGRIWVGTVVVVGSLFIAACTAESPSGQQAHTSDGCPVTKPSPHAPVSLPPDPVVSNPGVPEDAFGDESLWVRLAPGGGMSARADEVRSGYLWQKVLWWRIKPGQLVIEGHRLDGPGTFDADVGTVDEYGPTGFVGSILTFSAPGCWRITGQVGEASPTFVTRVVAMREGS